MQVKACIVVEETILLKNFIVELKWIWQIFLLMSFIHSFILARWHMPFHIPVLRPVSWAGPMHSLRSGTSVV